MPDIATIAGGPMTVGVNAGASSGIVITAHATIHTKASTWTEIIASTTYDGDWVMVSIGAPAPSHLTPYLVDIGVGASTAEVVLIPDLTYGAGGAAAAAPHNVFLFPLRVPRGSRISARCQGGTTVATIGIAVHVIGSPIDAPPGLGRVEAAGTVAASSRGTLCNDPGATPHTDGTWTQLLAASTFAYRWMCVGVTDTQDATWAATTTQLLDIGVGAGGSEQVLVSDLPFTGGANVDAPVHQAVCFPVAVVAGTRISARHRSSSGTAGDRRLEVTVFGAG